MKNNLLLLMWICLLSIVSGLICTEVLFAYFFYSCAVLSLVSAYVHYFTRGND